MFWRFGGYANISTVDSLLDKPNVSLEELLDDPELIQELKQHNTKLIEYLRDDNVLKRLMDYVIAPPLITEDDDNDDDDDDDDNGEAEGHKAKKDVDEKTSLSDEDVSLFKDEKQEKPHNEPLNREDLEKAEKQRLKYSYVACEILSSETWSILESMMVNEGYLRDFWQFLKRPAPLDSLQAGYFTKVNETLFDKKTEDMIEFFKSIEGVVPAILQHVDNPMVMDLLLKIISMDRVSGGQGTVEWLKNENLIPTLLSYLSSEYPAPVQTSAGDFLKAIITISANATQNDQPCIGPNSLTRQLVSAPCIEQLISFMLQGGNSLTVGVGIVIEVIRKNNSDYDPENAGGPDSPPTIYDPIYLGTLLRLFAQHIPDFMTLILSSKHAVVEDGKSKLAERGELNSAWGTRIEPLGFDRFKTCELMAELLHCSNMCLLNQIGSDDYIKQRDAEREKLVLKGPFSPLKKAESAADVTEKSIDINSLPASLTHSPKDTRGVETSNASEDDGFEDVVSAVENVTPKQKIDESQQSSGDPGNALGLSTSGPEQTNPLSPTASGLTDKVSEIALESNSSNVDAPANQSQSSHVPSDTPPTMSPRAEDVPLPLFASTGDSKETEQSESSTSQIENPPASAESQENTGRPGDEFFPQIQYDPNGQPVVGDYLKIMFVENQVVPTILGFFFRFPWNNFLHNVVYDVVQQVFNGPMDRGYNRSLAIDLFESGRITEQIVDGQRRSDEAQSSRNLRLGYMGHLTLIAEEVVKFTERHPPEVLSEPVMDRVLHNDWIDYVERTLSETRERDNAILGGVRPDAIGLRQAVLSAVGVSQGFTGSSALANAGLNGGGGGSAFDGFDTSNQGSASSATFNLNGSSGFGSSSDDEDEEMEDQEDDDAKGTADQAVEGGSENSSQPIPILAPPPAPLNIAPSRARRQLAARLALHKQQAAESAANEEDSLSTPEKQSTGSEQEGEDPWQSNPFVIAGLEDDSISHAFPSPDPSHNKSGASSAFPHTGFTHPESPSTNSSDEDTQENAESIRRSNVRIPLEVDDEDDEMGEMVAPGSSGGMIDSDEEDEAIINESLGYANFYSAKKYGGYRERERSMFDDDADDHDSSDGEDEGLVEILVPGKKQSGT